ncbi:MAG TPA: sulfurtransferase TusA family protein [Thermoplasmata archaeon]|nr:sulfurtransferase TusA family protein [Thermoplasmata archaeon]
MIATELRIPEAGTRRVIDTRGLLCPYPFIEAKHTLESLPSGSEVEILTDSEATATSSIPILCAQRGYSFTSAKGGDIWRLVVRKP